MGIDKKYKSELKMKKGQDYEARGENLHAIQVYSSIIAKDPEYSDAYFSLAELFEKQGNINSAKNILYKFINENPDNNFVRLYFAQFLLRHSKWDDAIDTLQSLNVKEEPLALFFLGYSFFMLKNFEPAKINFLQFLSSGNKTELLNETNFYLAKTETELGNFPSALEYAKKSEIFYTNFWELNLVLAKIYFHLMMLNHSVSAINKAIRLNSCEPSVYEWAGKIFMKEGEYLKAEENFMKHIEMSENPSSDVYSELGNACLKNNKTKEALDYFELALNINPHNKLAADGKKNVNVLLKLNANDV